MLIRMLIICATMFSSTILVPGQKGQTNSAQVHKNGLAHLLVEIVRDLPSWNMLHYSIDVYLDICSSGKDFLTPQSVAPQFSPLLSMINKKQGDSGVEVGRKGDGMPAGGVNVELLSYTHTHTRLVPKFLSSVCFGSFFLHSPLQQVNFIFSLIKDWWLTWLV